jgi:predicted amidophosphoribosyltransferase
VERITFCPACGAETPFRQDSCESCGAPLMRKGRDWTRWLRHLPRPSPLALLVAGAVVALAIAILTAVAHNG